MVSIFRNKNYVLFLNIVMESVALATLSSINKLNLIKLYIGYNDKIIDISFMKNLKYLNARGKCGIDQNSIEGLDLIELDVDNNDKIKYIPYMKNLKILSIRNNCGIDQNGINI